MQYDRDKAVAYAHQWAYRRNPQYYSFNGMGGDCTNFISQCLYAGCGVMNHTNDTGWYYYSVNDRAPAWSGVEFLYRFLTKNAKSGPYAMEKPLSEAQRGDIVQLCFDGDTYGHTLFVVDVADIFLFRNILIATHSDDSDNRPLTSYSYQTCRLLHIEGVRD